MPTRFRSAVSPAQRSAFTAVRPGGVRAATRNHVPVTIAEFAMKARAHVEQEIPASYNGFAYVIDGSVGIGEDGALLNAGQVGWLDRPETEGTSVLRIVAGEEGARVVLYTGQPQGDPIVSHGPFIGDSRDDIVRLYAEYRAARFDRLSDLARGARIL
jgi:redox-sensitive bicupin YhaK (pirin superfamily)